MNPHKNARTTPFGRALMVRRVTEFGWTAGAAAPSRIHCRTIGQRSASAAASIRFTQLMVLTAS
jgi:hypothetical protein